MDICDRCSGYIDQYSVHSCGPQVGDIQTRRNGSMDVWTGHDWQPVGARPAGPIVTGPDGTRWQVNPDGTRTNVDPITLGTFGGVPVVVDPSMPSGAPPIFLDRSRPSAGDEFTRDQRFQDLVAKAIGLGSTPAEIRASAGFDAIGSAAADAGSMMHEMTEAITKIREAELAAEERWYEGKLGALGAVLRRRPIRLDCRSEVVSYLHETFAASVPVESWRTGAYYGGTSISVDDELEPGVVRAHFYAHPDAGPRGLIRTDEIVIGDLGD